MSPDEFKRLSGNGSIVSAALILGASSLLSRIIGLIRERVFTTTFGAGDTFDAFVAAFRVPDLIFNLIVLGALSAAFIPLFTDKLVKGRKGGQSQAFDFAVSLFNLIVIGVGVLSALYALFASNIVPLIAPGFTGEKLELTIQLSRIMALQPIFLSISFIFSGILNSFKRFAVYAIAPVLYNLGIIFGVVYLVPMMGVAGLGWGVVLGVVLHLLVQLPSALRVGFRWRPLLISSPEDFRQLWRLMLPRVFGLAAQQLNLVVVTILGSGLLAGSITAFHLANNIYHLPIGIFGIAFAQAAFPTMAEQVARKQTAEFRHTVTRSFRYIMFFVIPISAFLFLLRAQSVRVLFGDGAFDWEDTILTFETLKFLIISIFAQATIPLLTRAFYAKQNTRTPVMVAILSMVVNVVLALYLSPLLGVQGLALAFSIASIVQLVALLGMLHWNLHGFDDWQVISSLSKIVLAAIISAAVVQLLKYPVAAVVDMQRFWGIFVQLIITSTGGAVMYIWLCWMMKCDEILVVNKYLPRSLRVKFVGGTDTPRFGEVPE
ncbi:MAG: murein biosynthesis integral membrane protein MurJ [Candidatus Andersenbacteria bacterium]